MVWEDMFLSMVKQLKEFWIFSHDEKTQEESYDHTNFQHGKNLSYVPLIFFSGFCKSEAKVNKYLIPFLCLL